MEVLFFWFSTEIERQEEKEFSFHGTGVFLILTDCSARKRK
jgi:hypothetical protein